MAEATQPRADSYDVVVIGSGLGGVSAAALLAKHGQKVLLAERGDAPGGYAHAFKREKDGRKYLFDAAIHVIPEGEFTEGLLDYLGVKDKATLVECDSLYGVVFPEFRLNVPMGREEFVATHVEHFPHEAQAIRDFFAMLTKIFYEASALPFQLSMTDMGRAEAEFPNLFKYRTYSAGEFIDEFIKDPHLKAVLGACWSYMGLPPSRLSCLHFSQLLNVIIDGSFYCKGSFQKLVDAFIFALERDGGELVVNNPVDKILIEDSQVRGVTLAGGRQVHAPVVVSNADARETFDELVGEELLPRGFVRRLRRMKPSVSAFLIFAGTTMDLAAQHAAHDNFLFTNWDHEQTYQDVLQIKPGGMSFNVPTLVDPSLAPPGEHAVILRALAPFDIGKPWREERDRYAEEFLTISEQAFPGFRDSITFFEAATPLVLERFTRNYQGACYGWEISPEQTGSGRLSHETPIAGLYMSGHWTQEGAGSFRTMTSGINTARIILGKAGVGDVIPTFKRSDLPQAWRAEKRAALANTKSS
jgi:phytoene desaturase